VKALALQADFPEALNNLGLILGRRGELAAAEQRFRQALEKRPDYGEAANNRALVLVARGDPDAAVLSASRASSAKAPFARERLHHARQIHLAAQRLSGSGLRPQNACSSETPRTLRQREILDSTR
jgi:Flp pilus assembly protein TadD